MLLHLSCKNCPGHPSQPNQFGVAPNLGSRFTSPLARVRVARFFGAQDSTGRRWASTVGRSPPRAWRRRCATRCSLGRASTWRLPKASPGSTQAAWSPPNGPGGVGWRRRRFFFFGRGFWDEPPSDQVLTVTQIGQECGQTGCGFVQLNFPA